MKAMILAAGLGTRLRPLTDERPKALVEIAGRTLLDIALSRLRSFGIHEVIVNVHHFAPMILEYLAKHDNFGMRIEISREDILLDTGGGLKKAAWFFLEDSSGRDEPFLLHNVDVLSTIDLHRMVEYHRKEQALATLAVKDRPASRYLLFDEQFQLCGRVTAHELKWQPVGASPRIHALGFGGIHVISPRLLGMMTEEGAFPITATYLRLAARQERILGFRTDEYYWRDLGRPENVAQATKDLEYKLLEFQALHPR